MTLKTDYSDPERIVKFYVHITNRNIRDSSHIIQTIPHTPLFSLWLLIFVSWMYLLTAYEFFVWMYYNLSSKSDNIVNFSVLFFCCLVLLKNNTTWFLYVYYYECIFTYTFFFLSLICTHTFKYSINSLLYDLTSTFGKESEL